MHFDEEFHGKSISRMLSDSKSIRELDIFLCEFIHPKSFKEMSMALINDKSKLHTLRLRSIAITNLEGPVIASILSKNKHLHTFDLEKCRIENHENIEQFICKLGKESNIENLFINGLQTDISTTIETLGEALS